MWCLCARWAEGTSVHRLSSVLSPFAHQISPNCKVIGPPSTLHGWNPHPSPLRRPPPSLPPSIFNTRDTSPLPQHGAHMPVILNLIKETLETGNTRSHEPRCNGSPVLSTFSSFSVFFSVEPSRVLLCLQKSAGSDRKPPFSLRLSICTSLEVEKAKQTSPIRLGEDRNVCMLVCRKR